MRSILVSVPMLEWDLPIRIGTGIGRQVLGRFVRFVMRLKAGMKENSIAMSLMVNRSERTGIRRVGYRLCVVGLTAIVLKSEKRK